MILYLFFYCRDNYYKYGREMTENFTLSYLYLLCYDRRKESCV